MVNAEEFKLQCPMEQNWININEMYTVDDLGFILNEGDIVLFGSIKFKILELRAMNNNDDPNKNIKGRKHEEEDWCKEVMSQETKSLQSTPANRPCCRVCLSTSDTEANPLVNPCICTGSVQFLHLHCLKQWLKSKIEVKDYGFLTLISYSQFECELCKTLIPTKVKYQSKIINFLEYERPYEKYLIIQNIPNETIDKTFTYIICFDEKPSVSIGRGKINDISMQDPSVSREHAKIELINNVFYLKDFKSKFGTLINLQSDVIFLPNKTFGLYYNKSHFKFCLKKTCMASFKCFKTTFFVWEDYNVLFAKIRSENESRKGNSSNNAEDNDSNSEYKKLKFTSDLIKKDKERMKGSSEKKKTDGSNMKKEVTCFDKEKDKDKDKQKGSDAQTNRDIPNSTGRELLEDNHFLHLSNVSQLNLMKQINNSHDQDDDNDEEEESNSNSDNLSLPKNINKEINSHLSKGNNSNDIINKMTINDIQKATPNHQEIETISKSSVKTAKKELINNKDSENNKQTLKVLNEHRDKIINHTKIIPLTSREETSGSKQIQNQVNQAPLVLNSVILEEKNESYLSSDLHVIDNNCDDDEESEEANQCSHKNTINTNPITLPQENLPIPLALNPLNHGPTHDLFRDNNLLSSAKRRNEREDLMFSANSKVKTMTEIEIRDTLKINEEIDKMSNARKKGTISKEDLINNLFITEQSDRRTQKRQSDATLRSLARQLMDSSENNDKENDNCDLFMEQINDDNNQSSEALKKKKKKKHKDKAKDKEKDQEKMNIVSKLFEG